jgi:Uma2 family endonuclease
LGVAVPSVQLATSEDLAVLAARDRLEIIHGSIVERASPSAEHSAGSAKLGGILHPFHRRAGGGQPGGWWLHVEVHCAYGKHETVCHDAAGWRRDRVPTRPTGWPVAIRPDWVCEIVSPRHERRDFVDKLEILRQAEVPHYWLIHPEEQMLLVHRWGKDGYVTVLSAGAGKVVRAEPFDAIEIHVDELFGGDPED